MSATIRPPGPDDLAALAAFFGGLSMRTRVLRFFAPVWPTAALIRLACGWAVSERARSAGSTGGRDGARDEERGAGSAGGSGPAGDTDALVATAGGAIIGHAMAADQPAGPAGRVTEIGVVVADACQGHGVGSALARALISRAEARGVTTLTMEVLPGNREVLAMISGHWPAARTRRGPDSVTIEIGLSPAGPARVSSAGRNSSGWCSTGPRK